MRKFGTLKKVSLPEFDGCFIEKKNFSEVYLVQKKLVSNFDYVFNDPKKRGYQFLKTFPKLEDRIKKYINFLKAIR